jgi:YHS domain-containing protein
MSRHAHKHVVVAPEEVLDPVCGMTISPNDAVGHVDYYGQTYYFCSQSCLDQFRATPEAFLGDRPATPTTPADMEREYTCPMDPEVRQKGPGACPKCGMALEPVDVTPVTRTEWTCPMHPEIVRDAPGACPICGMALEPRVVTIEERNPELDDMTRRFWWSTALTAPMLALMISEFLPGRPLQTLIHGRWHCTRARSAARTCPVHPRQAAHSAEFPGVRRDERRTPTTRLASQQHVVRADWLTGGFEFGPYGPCLSGVLFVELRPFKRACEERVQALRIAFLPLALTDAIPKLERDNRR